MGTFTRSIALISLCALLPQRESNAQSMQWLKCYGGTDADFGRAVLATGDGKYLLVGNGLSNDGDFSNSHGALDGWVAKLDTDGTVLWKRAYGGTGQDELHAVCLAGDGGFVVAGVSQSSDGDLPVGNGGDDVWVMKLTATGDIAWARTFGGSGYEAGFSIVKTIDGGYAIAGMTMSTDGDVSGNHDLGIDGWFLKISATGVFEWQKCLGGTGSDGLYGLKQSADGSFFLAGSTSSGDGTVTGGMKGESDAWVIKLSSKGDVVWEKNVGGTATEGFSDLQVLADGSCVAAGFVRSSDGDVTGRQGGITDIWVVKFRPDGTIGWTKCLGGNHSEEADAIEMLQDGSFVIAGGSRSVDGMVTGNQGHEDSWLVRISATGSLMWQKTAGGSSNDAATHIALTPEQDILVTGHTTSEDGDVIDNQGAMDIFLATYKQDATAIEPLHKAGAKIILVPNPARDYLEIHMPGLAASTVRSVKAFSTSGAALTSGLSCKHGKGGFVADISGLLPGVYFLLIETGQGTYTAPFVKR
jgi:hypothetical protein